MKHEVTTLNTKKAFSASLKKIMEKKAFSKITISEIVSDCGVNRNTFYYHFESIQDLLKWTLEQEAVEIVKSFDLILDAEEAILFVLKYVEENKRILNCAYNSIDKDEIRKFFHYDFSDIIMKLIDSVENMLNTKNTDAYKKFLCDFYAGAIANQLINILKSKKPYDKNKLVRYMTSTLKSGLTAALENTYN